MTNASSAALVGLNVLIFLFIHEAHATEGTAASCVPPCRSGYMCHGGQCISKCNPPCDAGQTCTDEGQCVAVPTATPARAAPTESVVNEAPRTWNIGIKGGLLLPGEVYISIVDRSFDTDMGLMLVASADAIIVPKLSVGAFALMAFSGIENAGDARITTLGGTIKARFDIGEVQLRPGLAIGYQSISPDEDVDTTSGLDVGAVLEAVFEVNGQFNGVAELGFISQPAGGNDDTDLTFAPILYLVGGVEFGG